MQNTSYISKIILGRYGLTKYVPVYSNENVKAFIIPTIFPYKTELWAQQ